MPQLIQIVKRPPRLPDRNGHVREWTDDPEHPWAGNCFSLQIPDGIRNDGMPAWYDWMSCGTEFVKQLHEQTGKILAKEALENRAPA